MIGVKPAREYMVPRIAVAAILGGCVGASIAAWRVGGAHPGASAPGSGAGTGAVTQTAPSAAGAACVTTDSGGPPAAAAAEGQAAALCEALQFDRTAGGTLGLDPIKFRMTILEHFAPQARAVAEDFIATQLQKVQEGTRLVQAGGHVAGYSVNVTSHFDSYSKRDAVVELWGFVLDATDATPPTELPTTPEAVWAIDRVHLAFTASGWRVTALDGVPGPAPKTPDLRVLPGIPEQITWDPVQTGVGR